MPLALLALPGHPGSALTIPHILTGLGLLALYVLFVLVRPTHRCWHCHRRRMVHRGKRAHPCGVCHATGRVRWPGTTLTHRTFWKTIGQPIRARLAHKGRGQ
jgi:hypothetical protein